ncbi:MAG: hypothetical protein FWE64_03535 [Alphaproteobacteria bacterium]|nr:hypothetical protein [Alphaproteobacteria bacterium]
MKKYMFLAMTGAVLIGGGAASANMMHHHNMTPQQKSCMDSYACEKMERRADRRDCEKRARQACGLTQANHRG